MEEVVDEDVRRKVWLGDLMRPQQVAAVNGSGTLFEEGF